MIIVGSLVAIALVVAQGLAVWAFLRFVRSFGAYTESQRALTGALLSTHESNLALHQSNQALLTELRRMHPSQVRENVA